MTWCRGINSNNMMKTPSFYPWWQQYNMCPPWSEGRQGWCRCPLWLNPPPAGCRERPQDGISREHRLAAAEKYFGGRLWCLGNILEFIEVELGLEDTRGAHKPSGRAPLGRTLEACGLLGTLLALSPSHVGVFWSKKNHRKILFRLDSVWYSFSVKLKNKEKQKLALGSGLIS